MENETQNQVMPENENKEEAPKKKERKSINFGKGGLLWSIWNFLEAALILVLGIICFVYTAKASTNNSDISYDKVISVILFIGGIFLILGGALKIVVNFLPVIARSVTDAIIKEKIKSQLSYDLVVGGAIELAIGIAFVISYTNNGGLLDQMVSFIAQFLAIFIGTLVTVAGTSLILFAVGFIVSKLYKLYLPIIEIVFGAALIALGIIVFIYLAGNADLTKMISLVILGIILVLAGVAMAILTVVEINKIRVAKAIVNAPKDTIETEIVETKNND
ncbi:MAG: hypothetical protein MR990_00855 [Mollicutes bacterium]|nr:hypothetical protein [Mollicutes bacterium]MDD7043388.1 hypothetical protein [Mollicutes bacterium]MDY6070394.1 hypothetical protein [Bacilli bacterium]